jgi:hypothetical protein
MGSGASTVEDDSDLFNIGMSVAADKQKTTRGETKYANGDVYRGKWRYDQKHGRGRYTYCPGSEEGILYDGHWKHNVKHGRGTFYYRNGDSECKCCCLY